MSNVMGQAPAPRGRLSSTDGQGVSTERHKLPVDLPAVPHQAARNGWKEKASWRGLGLQTVF